MRGLPRPQLLAPRFLVGGTALADAVDRRLLELAPRFYHLAPPSSLAVQQGTVKADPGGNLEAQVPHPGSLSGQKQPPSSSQAQQLRARLRPFCPFPTGCRVCWPGSVEQQGEAAAAPEAPTATLPPPEQDR